MPGNLLGWECNFKLFLLLSIKLKLGQRFRMSNKSNIVSFGNLGDGPTFMRPNFYATG